MYIAIVVVENHVKLWLQFEQPRLVVKMAWREEGESGANRNIHDVKIHDVKINQTITFWINFPEC